MGKGDKKTRRGKVTAGSYGKTRPRNLGTSKEAAPKVEKAPKEVEVKAEKPKKAAKPMKVSGVFSLYFPANNKKK